MCNVQKRKRCSTQNIQLLLVNVLLKTFELTCSHLMPNAAYLCNPAGMLSKNSRLSNMANKYKRDSRALLL